MSDLDIRWIQRLHHYSKALAQLARFIEKGELNELEQQGLIQAFEYTYELAWKSIKNYFENQGETGIHGSRNAFRLAFRRGLIENGKVWMDMIKSRMLTTHTYNENVADELARDITEKYFDAFVALEKTLRVLEEKGE